MTGDEGSASEADAAARGTEDTEEGAEDDESQAHQADLSMYRVLKSDVRDNVLVFNEPGGFAVWLRESVVPDAALANFRSHARDRQWRKQVQRRLKCLTVLNEPGGVGGERPRGGRSRDDYWKRRDHTVVTWMIGDGRSEEIIASE